VLLRDWSTLVGASTRLCDYGKHYIDYVHTMTVSTTAIA